MRSAGRKPKRVIEVKVLPGQPLDGTGRVCIHLVVRDDKRGTFHEPHFLRDATPSEVANGSGPLIAERAPCRIACDRKKVPSLKSRGGAQQVLMRTDDYRAVTCPACIASDSYRELEARTEARRQ